jgi:UDP-glucose 4-epimerase
VTAAFDPAGFAGSRILVVGGAGFVGSNLVHALLPHDPAELWVVDNLLSAELSNVPDDARVRLVLGSIAEDATLAALPRGGLDHVFHLACYHGNQSSIADPLADHANNTLTTLKLFDWLGRAAMPQSVVYAAAGCAVAEKTWDDAAATSEDAPVSLAHDSPYSISKLVGEMYGLYFHGRQGLPFVRARFQNVFGPREILGAGRWRGTVHTVWRNVIPTFIWKALHGQALPLDNGGIASRDFIYVDDLVRGLMHLALLGQPGEAYNLASGEETTILELAHAINRLTGNPTPPAIAPARDWDRSGRRFGDPAKARDQLGFVAETRLEQGLAATVEWTRANRALIEAAIARHARHLKLPPAAIVR